MTPTHHPDSEDLLTYASGASPDWISLVVACHLTYCEDCREEVRLLEDLGGALLAELPATGDAPWPPNLDERAATRGATDQDRTARREAAETAKIPRPLHAFLADEPRFRFLAPGVQHIPLTLSVGGVPARIVRFKPGFTVPDHAHRGLEMVLVLDGELTDGVTKEVFVSGDLSRREEGTAHTQHITSDDPCTCLVVSAAPIVPSTLWGKFLKALTGV